MSVTGTGQVAAEVKPLYPAHKSKRKPVVNAKGVSGKKPKGK